MYLIQNSKKVVYYNFRSVSHFIRMIDNVCPSITITKIKYLHVELWVSNLAQSNVCAILPNKRDPTSLNIKQDTFESESVYLELQNGKSKRKLSVYTV